MKNIIATVIASLVLLTSTIPVNAVEKPKVQEASHDAVKWRTNLRAAATEAHNSKKILLVMFSMEGCSWCTEMKSKVFSERRVSQLLTQKFIPVEIDVNSDSAREFHVSAVPTLVAIGFRPGLKVQVLGDHVGYMDHDATVSFLNMCVHNQ